MSSIRRSTARCRCPVLPNPSHMNQGGPDGPLAPGRNPAPGRPGPLRSAGRAAAAAPQPSTAVMVPHLSCYYQASGSYVPRHATSRRALAKPLPSDVGSRHVHPSKQHCGYLLMTGNSAMVKAIVASLRHAYS
jgi:hypothetical protein